MFFDNTTINLVKNSRIAVAVSGGPDSLCLALALNEHAKKNNICLTALTVDHQLRSNSKNEALYVKEILQEHGIKHNILTWEHELITGNLQAIARQERYNLLENWCLNHDCQYLFTAHHVQDQQETFFLRLRKSNSLLGLAGMRTILNKRKCIVIRPFLQYSKQCLSAYLKNKNIQYVEDPSNNNLKYERVFWRTYLKKQSINPKLVNKIHNIRNSLELWVKNYITQHVYISHLGYASITREQILKLPNEFQFILISYILRAIGNSTYSASTKNVQRILFVMQTEQLSAITTRGVRISQYQKSYLFIREYKNIKQSIMIESNSPKYVLWDNRFIVNTNSLQNNTLKEIGEEGWQQILLHYPGLKKLTIHRHVLWGLPGFWQKNTLIKENNMIFKEFIYKNLQNSQKQFRFAHGMPFIASLSCTELKNKGEVR